MLNIFKEIEKKYPVESIKINDIQIWPYLRIYLGFKLIFDIDRITFNFKILINFIRTFFYGFFNLFRKYEYIVFSVSEQRKLINNKYVDRFDYIAEMLNNTLFFESSLSSHFKKKNIPTKHICSKNILYLFEVIISNIFIRNIKIENEHLIKEISEKYNIDVDYRTLSKRFIAQYKIMKFIIKKIKPKAVFMITPYTNMGYVKALKDNGIKVIELQHGVINFSHPAYNIFKRFDSGLYPDYLLTYGKKEKNVFTDKNYYINKNNVIPIGHFYIDYITNKYKGDKKLKRIVKNYNKIIAVTSQDIFDDDLIPFLKKSADLDKTIIYIFIPRKRTKSYYSKYNFPENMIIADWLNCYEIIIQSDFHSTINSTCAIEAPSMGIQNILLNINNQSKDYYGTILDDRSITSYVNTPEEFVEIINSFKILEKDKVIKSNKDIIVPYFQENCKKALNLILA